MADDDSGKIVVEPPKPDPFDEEEVEALHKEIEWDTRAGQHAKHFERELDEVFSNPSQRHDEEPEMSTEERERIEFELQQFMRALKFKLNDNLISKRMRVLRVIRTATRDGFFVEVKDREDRRFECQITDQEGIDLGMAHGADIGRAIIDTVTKRILNARAVYFTRAGLSELN